MTLDTASIRYFADFVRQHLGIVYSETDFYQLETRLNDVARHFGFKTIEELCYSAKTDMTPLLKRMILDYATNGETLFFRDPYAFSAIESVILAKGFPPSRTTPWRVWSAACSTGQEPYSLSMLCERYSHILPTGEVKILATDISDRSLAAAERGMFSQLQVQRGLDTRALVENFDQVEEPNGEKMWRIKERHRKRISFAKQNLLESFVGLGTFDLILCRNVLIYQSPESKKEIIARLYKALEPNGYLLLGAAESVFGLSDAFEFVRTEKATIYRKIVT